MGVVYKAHDTRLKRTVALKFLPPDLTRDEEAKTRFVHEAQAASALQHPNICTIHDIDQTDDHRLFIVMDCYEGETLKSRIAKGESRPERLPADEGRIGQAGSRGMRIEEALDIAAQIAQGLQKAHEHGIVHRDIKPANVMLTADGVAKIVDFGLAKLSGRTLLTKSGTTLGTAAYMSPEQARGEQVDERTDIWSLGVVLYEMLTGKRPFESEYEQALVYSILNQDPRPIQDLRPEVPEAIEKICRRAMAKDAKDRYQTAAELIADLDSYKAGSQLSKSTRRLVTKRWRLVYGIAAAVVFLAVIVVVFYLIFWSSQTIDSIAVLPFENLSGDAEQQYFYDEMTIAAIDAFAKVKSLRSISWQSVKKFRKTEKSIPEIAKELGVQAIVSAQGRRSEGNVSISVKLIQASPEEKTLWLQSFDRSESSIIALQSEIAGAIVRETNVAVTTQELKALSRTRSVNPEAYEAYLRGRYFSRRSTEEGLKKALASFQRSIEIDSTFADAFAGLANAYTLLALFGIQAPTEAYPKARAAAGKASELDETSVAAHTVLATIMCQFDWKWSEAEDEYKRAISLSPRGRAPFMYGFYLALMGRYDEAISETRRALEMDPVSPGTYFQLGFVLYYARRHDESIAQLRKALELDSTFGNAYMTLGLNYAQKRMYPEAVAACKRAIDLMPEEQFIFAGCGFVYALAGKRAEALKCLENLQRLSVRGHVDPYNMAWLYDGLGDNDQTLKWLQRAYNERSASMPALRTETWTDRLRSDPRFQDLLRRMNFPQ